jgi:hypothetical protein
MSIEFRRVLDCAVWSLLQALLAPADSTLWQWKRGRGQEIWSRVVDEIPS